MLYHGITVAILTCARKPTWVSLIYRTEPESEAESDTCRLVPRVDRGSRRCRVSASWSHDVVVVVVRRRSVHTPSTRIDCRGSCSRGWAETRPARPWTTWSPPPPPSGTIRAETRCYSTPATTSVRISDRRKTTPVEGTSATWSTWTHSPAKFRSLTLG